ncbi:MAG: glycyl-radical enzyme activating protein [bacterium]
MSSGIIFDIQRFSLHDGPGIRTTVFFKGCPLRCLWCHNPESISPKIELAFYSHKCIGCNSCVLVCPTGALQNDNLEGKRYDEKLCQFCFKCVDACPTRALVLQGKIYDLEEVLDEVIKDIPFYKQSGGVTLSGGEPTFQFDFCLDLLKSCKENGISTALDTSGFVSWDKLKDLLPFVDIFLYDIKHMNLEEHKKLTGVPNEIILENLYRLDRAEKWIEIRVPIIPGYNDSRENIVAVANFIAKLKSVRRVKLLPYHKLGLSKPWLFNSRRGILELEPPKKEDIEEIKDLMGRYIDREKIY